MSRSSRESGFALLVVLWTVVLMSLVAAAFSRTARVEAHSAAVDSRALRASAIGEAGIWLALRAALSGRDDERRVSHSFEIDGIAAEVRVEPVAARVNVNVADPGTLDLVLQAAEVPADERSRLADRIIDWRDLDSERGANGLEDAGYRSRASALGAKDSPFYSVDELRFVADVDEATFRRVAPLITVLGADTGPDPRFAPNALAQAMQTAAPTDVASSLGAESALPSSGLMRFSAVAVVDDVRADIVAVIHVAGSPDAPYEILSWHATVPGVVEN